MVRATVKIISTEEREYKYSKGRKITFETRENELLHSVFFKSSYYFEYVTGLDVGQYCVLRGEVIKNNDIYIGLYNQKLLNVYDINKMI